MNAASEQRPRLYALLRRWPTVLGVGVAALTLSDFDDGREFAIVLLIASVGYLAIAMLERPQVTWWVLIGLLAGVVCLRLLNIAPEPVLAVAAVLMTIVGWCVVRCGRLWLPALQAPATLIFGERTYADFQANAGPRAELLPAVYEVLGLAKPDPSASIHADEESLLERFLEVWAATPDEDSLIRAARLMAQGTRAVMLGWTDLMDEQVAEPARQRLLRGEIERFPDDVSVAIGKLTRLAPEMFLWLSGRYLEHRSVNGIVEGFERYLATRGLVPAPDPLGPPAIVFVDLSGFTRLTRERGDESAAVAVTSLQRHADATARLYGGRLVKLLGDGAMLRLGDATAGVEAALDLVEAMSDEGALWLHAGINAGPVIERDLDVFGHTANLASRIADVAGPGEVLASEAVVEATADDRFGFERTEDARLKGVQSPVALYRVSRSARPLR
jgi:adenylate cyclase